MTTIFKSSIAAAAAVFALSGVALSGVALSSAAQAESITISLAGKDAPTIHAEITKAAYQVCREVGSDSIVLTGQADCVSDTIAKADADLRGLSADPIRKAELSADLRSPR